MTWNPGTYMTFGDHRTRPAVELAARVPLDAPKLIVDLGCGPGNSTSVLRARYPQADIVGVDSSPEMLEAARRDGPDGVTWVEADAVTFGCPPGTDLIYSNATLHWLESHETLFPRLMDGLAAAGVLAVQMPNNFDAPSHRLLADLAAQAPWSQWCSNLRPARPVAAPEAYFGWLSAGGAVPDIWTTTYYQALTGDNPVLDWTRGTALTPYLAALPQDRHAAFLREYGARLSQAYPQRADGVTLFPFERLFMIAQKC